MVEENIMSDTTYKIVRTLRDNSDRVKFYKNHTIKTGLTLKEAQAHCSDPETSSSTCTTKEGILRTNICGPWFDTYEKE
jgi:hypothetical protein